MTDAQKRFCDEYLINFNATRAYKMAYPSCKKDETANAASSRLLRNVKVKEYIYEKQKEMQKRTEVTQDMVINELAKIAFYNNEQTVELKTSDKIKALELLGKHLGMFKEQIDISQDKAFEVNINVVKK